MTESMLKKTVVPTLIILAAATCVVLLSLPLADTQWAAGVRAGFAGEEGGEGVPRSRSTSCHW